MDKIIADFPDVFVESLTEDYIRCPPIDIPLRKDVEIIPQRSLTARAVPLHMQEQADKAIQDLLDKGIIVPEPEATMFVSPVHFVPKPNSNKLRSTVDYKALNKYLIRQPVPFPTPNEIFQKINPKHKFFLSCDLVSGYHQLLLSEEASKITTFLCHRGTFRYTRLPMGISTASDHFVRITDQALANLKDAQKLVDDVLLSAETREQLYQKLRELALTCQYHHIQLSSKKVKIGKKNPICGIYYNSEWRGTPSGPDCIDPTLPNPRGYIPIEIIYGIVQPIR